MITRIQTPSAINAYLQYPLEGTGTASDPFDWYTVDTVDGANSTVTIVEEGDMDAVEIYFNAKLTASQLYTFSISGVDEMSTTVTIYYEGSQVAQSTFDGTWSLTYTPSATGTYLIKVATYSFGMAGTMTTTPVPTEITAWIAKVSGVYASTGFSDGKPERYANTRYAGLSSFAQDLVFGVRAASGLIDLSPNPIALTASGGLTITDGYFNFAAVGNKLSAVPADKLNIGTGNWTVDIDVAGVAATDSIMVGSSAWATGAGNFVYKFNSSPTCFGMTWSGVHDYALMATTALTDETRYTLRYIRDGLSLKMYVNGTLADTIDLSSYILSGGILNFNVGGGNLMLGGGTSANQFIGKIYSVFIWSRAIA